MSSSFSLIEKESEVSNVINLLETTALNNQTSVILKSSIMLMLYNAIEATMTELLETVHEQIAYEKFSDLSKNLQDIMLEYFWTAKPNKHVYDTFLDLESFPFFDDYTKKINLFSGNLDARKINEILQKYGIDCIKSDKKDKLLEIKSKRNQLAHGELSFKIACRDLTIEDVKRLKDAVYECLKEMCNNTEEYLIHKKFLKN